MAKRKTKNALKKEIKKQSKKHPIAVTIALVVFLCIAGVAGFFLYKNAMMKEDSSSSDSSTASSSKTGDSSDFSWDGTTCANLDFYFLTLNAGGTLYNGDSIYIKAGDTDILIDAGSKSWNCSVISDEINKHCTDGKLEYVIATHADADHIPGFYGTKENGIFYKYNVGTIIDFPMTDKKTTTYTNYRTARSYAVSKGAKHYTALECWNESNGAQKVYTLGEGIAMEILYQRYYEEKNSESENNYSVCLLFRQGEKKMLFAGDLEEEGIASLLASNTIGEVDLFKGGHHGSINANPDSLLSAIKPKTICTCCVAGSNEYTANNSNTMPYQATINNWAKYTDDVYITNYAKSTGVKQNIGDGGDLNGTTNVHYDPNGNKTVSGSNNSLKLKDTDWMKNNRTMPSSWK